MNSKSSMRNTKLPLLKALSVGAALLAVSVSSTYATLTVDLRASAVDVALGSSSNGGKTLTLSPGATGNITLQVWAQIQNVGQVGEFGIQSLIGSVKSTTASGAVTGAVSTMTIGSPFNISSRNGVAGELTVPVDTIGDLGSNATAANINTVLFRKDPTTGGVQVGTVFYSTATASAGATFNPITNGFEFLMGTATLSIANFTAGTAATVSWVIAPYTSAANKGTIAAWVQGDGVQRNGNVDFAQMIASAPISIVAGAIPEPSAFGMLAIGALGLVGFRRMGLRRTA